MKINKKDFYLFAKKHKGILGKNYLKDIKRLDADEPMDYVLGNSEFLGCLIDLSFKPLIPRVETEYWTEKVVEENKGRKKIKVLDIFSGSGCIGVAVAKKLGIAEIHFADSETDCIKQIKKNIKLNSLKSKTKVIKSDVFENIKGKYDIILANPPYIPITRKKSLPVSVVRYEAKEYLFGGMAGLTIIKRFIKDLASHLNPLGIAYMEFDSGQKSQISKIVVQSGLKSSFMRDQYNKYRWVKIFR